MKKIALVTLILLAVIGIIIFFIVHRNSTAPGPSQTSQNIFPFGNSSVPPTSTTLFNTTPTTNSTTTPMNPLQLAANERLREIANYPVTNFYAWIENKVTSEPKLNEKTNETEIVTSTVPTNVIRWNQKETGLLADAEVTNDSIIAKQSSQTIIPDAEELWFGNTGNTVVYRYFNQQTKNIDSFDGGFPSSAALTYCTTTFTTTLKKGARGNEVKELQKYVNQKLTSGLTVDGSFGSKLVTALKKVQVILSVPVTGITDQATRDAINADCSKIQAAFTAQNSAPAKLSGGFLTSNILRGTSSPDSSQIFFLEPNTDNSGVVGVLANPDGTNQKKIFSSPLTEWMPQWINKTTIAMTTLASHEADGYLYFLDTTTGNFKKILGPIRGLTTNTSPDGQMVLYSKSTDQGITTHVYTIANGNDDVLDIATIAEKCVWQSNTTIICAIPQSPPNGQYPDVWYQGLLSFNDVLWSIDTKNKAAAVLFSPKQSFDIVDLQLSPDEQYLYFINKSDETLWSLQMSPAS